MSTVSDYRYFNVTQLKERLRLLGIPFLSRDKKADLIALLDDYYNRMNGSKAASSGSSVVVTQPSSSTFVMPPPSGPSFVLTQPSSSVLPVNPVSDLISSIQEESVMKDTSGEQNIFDPSLPLPSEQLVPKILERLIQNPDLGVIFRRDL